MQGWPFRHSTHPEELMRILGRLSATAIVVLLVLAMSADSRAEKITYDKVPKKVRDVVENRFPNPKVTSVDKELEDGKVVYDIEFTHKGKKYEMDISEDGTLLDIEKEVAAKDLPRAVADAVKAKYPGCNLKVIMETSKVKNGKEIRDSYEITILTADNEERELIVSLDGKSIKGGKDEKK
jgi:uncharacterized membrane protein YkoI